MTYRGRFAPSPTGDLHAGSAATALIAWLSARTQGGGLTLRVEDIDRPRVVDGAEQRQLETLRWLGIDWDEGPDVGGPHEPYRQSERAAHYEAALATLAARDLLYYCDCSRAEIARIASAPHAGEDGPRYPGTCREHGLATRPWKRPPALRLRVPERTITVNDALQGTVVQNVHDVVGDFVLKRGDGTYAYQLVVVVDDLAMQVTEVVRGADLMSSAPRQVLLATLLDGAPPAFAHLPLVLDADGRRLAKRDGADPVEDERRRGTPPELVLAALARTLGLLPPDETHVRMPALLAAFDRTVLRARATVRFARSAGA